MPAPTQVVKNKPVATVGTTATVVTALIGYAVFRGWLDAGLGALLEPIAVVLAAAAVHALVSPYQKVRDVVERGLHITDADYGRLEALVEQYGLQIVTKELSPGLAAGPSPLPPVVATSAAQPVQSPPAAPTA